MTYGLVPLKVYLLPLVQEKCLSQFISICEKEVLQQPFFNNTSVIKYFVARFFFSKFHIPNIKDSKRNSVEQHDKFR